MRKAIQQLEEENAKLKKVIDILKKELNFDFIDESQKIVIDDYISWDMLNISLKQEEYELLKEVLSDECIE